MDADIDQIAERLSAALTDGTHEEFMLALRYIATEHGMTKVAEATKLNRSTLYHTLSPVGNPGLKSLRAILDVLGMRLTVVPMEKKT